MGKNCLIIEDNYIQREFLSRLVTDISEEIEVFAVDNLQDAYQILLENTIDFFIIDIILDSSKKGDISGIKLASIIREIPHYGFTPIIFITSLIDPKMFAYSGLHCFSYLEKPFAPEDAKAVIEEAMEYNTPKKANDILCMRKEGVLVPFRISQIRYIESQNRNILIYKSDGDVDVMPYMPCKQILKEAGNDTLVQCNRSIIVNRDFVRTLDKVNRIITLHGCDIQLSIGVTYVKKVLKEFCNC